MYFWDKLHSIFHAGAGPLYNLLYLWSRKVVTLSEGCRVIQHMGHLDGIQALYLLPWLFHHPCRQELLCHWGHFSNLLVIKPGEKFLPWFPHTWSGHRASTQRKSWGRTHHRAQIPFVTLGASRCQWRWGKVNLFLAHPKALSPEKRNLDCSQSQDGQRCHRVYQELLRHILNCLGLGFKGCLQEEGQSMSQECAWEKKGWLLPLWGRHQKLESHSVLLLLKSQPSQGCCVCLWQQAAGSC